jgi:hypothetical protein
MLQLQELSIHSLTTTSACGNLGSHSIQEEAALQEMANGGLRNSMKE